MILTFVIGALAPLFLLFGLMLIIVILFGPLLLGTILEGNDVSLKWAIINIIWLCALTGVFLTSGRS